MGPETEKGERGAADHQGGDERGNEAGRAAAPPEGRGDDDLPRLVAPGQGGSRQELDDTVERAGGRSSAEPPGSGAGDLERDLDDLQP